MSVSLGRFQDAFVDALYGLEPAAHDEAGRWVVSLSRQPGFAVYRNTVSKAAVDALRANFPTVERLVGARWFAAAAAIHVQDSRPEIAQLTEYGTGFADFLNAFEPARELPYLADVARLDRLWIEVFSAMEQPTLTLATLASAAPEELARICLKPRAAVRWKWFDMPVLTIWACNRAQMALPQPLLWRGEGVVLIRSRGHVGYKPLSVGGCRFLDACASGRPLDAASALALSVEPDLDFTQLLAHLFAAGTFVAGHDIDDQRR